MNIKRNLSETLKVYRSLEQKSLVDFAEELSIGKTTLQEIADRLHVNPLSLLSDCYDASDLYMAQMLLGSLDRFERLSIEDQKKGVILFDELVRILSRGQ